MRKIVQIAHADDSLAALCDDGSIWVMNSASDGQWAQIPGISQDEPAVRNCDLDVGESLRRIRAILAEADPIAQLEAMGWHLRAIGKSIQWESGDCKHTRIIAIGCTPIESVRRNAVSVLASLRADGGVS